MTTPITYAIAVVATIVLAWCAVFPAHAKVVFVALSLVSMAHWAAEVSA